MIIVLGFFEATRGELQDTCLIQKSKVEMKKIWIFKIVALNSSYIFKYKLHGDYF